MALDVKIICPLMKGPCIEDGTKVDGEIHACRFWVTVHGVNPQDGSVINVKDCSIALLPVLMIENSKTNRETGAAVEGLRNEVATGNQNVAQQLLLSLAPHGAKDSILLTDKGAEPAGSAPNGH